VFVEALAMRVAKASAATLRVPARSSAATWSAVDVLLGGFTDRCREAVHVAV
jgi:hypothetical protein